MKGVFGQKKKCTCTLTAERTHIVDGPDETARFWYWVPFLYRHRPSGVGRPRSAAERRSANAEWRSVNTERRSALKKYLRFAPVLKEIPELLKSGDTL